MKVDLPLSERTTDDNPKKSLRIRKSKATINGNSSDNISRKYLTNNCKINLLITEFLIKDEKDNDGQQQDDGPLLAEFRGCQAHSVLNSLGDAAAPEILYTTTAFATPPACSRSRSFHT